MVGRGRQLAYRRGSGRIFFFKLIEVGRTGMSRPAVDRLDPTLLITQRHDPRLLRRRQELWVIAASGDLSADERGWMGGPEPLET